MNTTEQKLDTEIPEAPPQEAPRRHGPLYWFMMNSLSGIARFGKQHKIFSGTAIFVVAWAIFVFRAYWQPAIVAARIHTPEIIVIAGLVWLLLRSLRRRKLKWAVMVAAMLAALIAMQVKMDLPPLRHVTLYYRYLALHVVDLTTLPTTDHERIQPLNSIRVLGSEAMKEVEQVSEPHFVRIGGHSGDDYRWTMGIEPMYELPKFFGRVHEVLDVSGLASSPNFSGQNRIPVSFRTGEGLHMGRNTHVATIRSLGLLRFFSYSPRDVRYLKDDEGKWVQVISLIRWRGIIFVWPEFGGVQVVHQSSDAFPETLWGVVKSWFVGDGEWIRPEDIYLHKYLQQQNNVPFEVTRYMAMSLRFQAGFTTPLPFYHKGDIRIPDLPGDQNDQPFCVFFRFGTSNAPSADDKLYDYFALEPYHDSKAGLNTSFFVPADGIGRPMVYQHYKINEALTGVSAIAPKVMESRKEYDWEQSQPVEHRPYIRFIGGKLRFFWFTSVVTYKDKKHAGQKGFIAGSTPAITLTDALYKGVIWVNADKAPQWPDELHAKFGDVWKSN